MSVRLCNRMSMRLCDRVTPGAARVLDALRRLGPSPARAVNAALEAPLPWRRLNSILFMLRERGLVRNTPRTYRRAAVWGAV